MSNIIPGVPTPRKGDSACVLSYCSRLMAQVDCILKIMQGTTGCVYIQLFDSDGLPLNLDLISNLRIMLFDEFECNIGEFYYPDVPSGCIGYEISILQETDSSGNITNEGLIRICLDESFTATSPGSIFAELLVTLYESSNDYSTGSYIEEIIGIPCIQVAQILPSMIYKNGCK